MSSKLYNVKRKIASILESDENLRSILGGGPIIVGWPLGEHIRLPSITITDVYLRREISGLGGLSNNLGQFEIYHIILQVDVWADSEGIRDRISEAIWSAVLKALDSLRVDGIIVGSPSASTINEVRYGIFRHSIRYPITCEVYTYAKPRPNHDQT